MHNTTDPSAVQVPAVPCPRCTFPGPHTPGPGAGPHTARLLCGRCGGFVQWLSTKTPAERKAARRAAMAAQPSTRLQRDYLTRLGYSGPVPKTKLEASDAITALLQQREEQP